MRRRRPQDDELYPRRLLDYRPEDWPDAECHPECAYWQAVMEWLRKHPEDDLPTAAPGPDTPWHPELI